MFSEKKLTRNKMDLLSHVILVTYYFYRKPVKETFPFKTGKN